MNEATTDSVKIATLATLEILQSDAERMGKMFDEAGIPPDTLPMRLATLFGLYTGSLEWWAEHQRFYDCKVKVKDE